MLDELHYERRGAINVRTMVCAVDQKSSPSNGTLSPGCLLGAMHGEAEDLGDRIPVVAHGFHARGDRYPISVNRSADVVVMADGIKEWQQPGGRT